MIDESKLTTDEYNRIAQYETVKEKIQREVNAEIASHADHLDEHEQAEAEAAGEQLKRKALAQVTRTDSELERSKAIARLSQVIDYVFYLIYGLISLQITLDLLGARRGNGFRNFVDTICAPLLA